MNRAEGARYAAAGVDIEAYAAALERDRPLIASTWPAGREGGLGGFSGLFRLPHAGGLLAASADGVGTKIKVAIAYGRHRGIGHDLVNHCVNDIATARARPLFLLDYFASGRLQPDVFEEVVSGLVEACAASGCALLGGETAEMPGMYALGDYDLAGFVVGIVDDGPEPEPVRAGDVLLGLGSSGLHSNGFSLVREVFDGVHLDTVYPELGRPLGEELLVPHRAYLAELRERSWKAAAHITGGGLIDNLPRALPAGLAAELVDGSWPEPPIFGLIAGRGRVERAEMLRTFNVGLGMVLVASEPDGRHPVVGRVVEAGAGPRVRFR